MSPFSPFSPLVKDRKSKVINLLRMHLHASYSVNRYTILSWRSLCTRWSWGSNVSFRSLWSLGSRIARFPFRSVGTRTTSVSLCSCMYTYVLINGGHPHRINIASDAPGDPGGPGGQYPLQGGSVGGYVGGGGVYTTLAATTHSTQAVTVNTFSIVQTVFRSWLYVW